MPRAIDLVCGCGGLSVGFQNAGFQIVHAFDNWDKAVNIYNTNFDDHEAEILDVYNLTTGYLNTFRPDVIIGGPPCQDYSSAGQQDETRGRANLTIRFAELVCESGVQWFVMENVDRIEKSQTLPKAIAMFRDAGYGLTRVVLDASRCGVPQKRKRFFMIGRLGSEDDFLEHALLSDQNDHNMTIREYLGDEFDTEFYYRHPGDATDDLSRVRPLTTLERARIQTFPREFTFEGSKTDLEQIIGNAVPVELAAYVGRHLLDYMNDCLVEDL